MELGRGNGCTTRVKVLNATILYTFKWVILYYCEFHLNFKKEEEILQDLFMTEQNLCSYFKPLCWN